MDIRRRAFFARTIVALFAAAALLLGATKPGAATDVRGSAPMMISREAPVRIMALGDSITAGVGPNGIRADDGGYRGTLESMLADAGYHAHFVGSRTDYSAALSERGHEGWPGYVLRSFPADPGPGQLYGPVVADAIHAADPDVILLMAGTNDLLRSTRGVPGYTVPTIVHSMDLVLREIFRTKPGVEVIVAPVVASPRIDACDLAKFNGDNLCGPAGPESLKSLVAAYARRGFHITLAARMARAVPRDDDHFPDGIHPCGDGGYAAVARAWFSAIKAITDITPAEPVAKQ